MPRILPPGFRDKLYTGRNIVTHSTVEIFLLGDAVLTKAYYLASAEVEIKGTKYRSYVRNTGQIRDSLASSADRSTVQLFNLDDLLGIELTNAREQLYGAEIRIGRYRLDLDGAGGEHRNFFTGVVADVEVDEQDVILTVIADAYGGVSVGADRLATANCQWLYRDADTCGYAGPHLECNFLLNHPDGCAGRWGSPDMFARYGGFVYIESKDTVTSSLQLSTPSSYQLVKTASATLLQQPTLQILGAPVTNDNVNKLTKIDLTYASNGDWINVKSDYGAVGDGVADDTTAINNAFNEAIIGPRKTVYFPKGTYLVTSTLDVYRFNVRGAGVGASVILCNTLNVIVHMKRDSLWRGGSLEDITIRGNVAAGTGQWGVWVDDNPFVYEVLIRRVRIEGCGGHGLVIQRGFSSSFEHIHITNCEADPFYYDAANMPGNYHLDIYVGDIRLNGKQAFRIKAGDFVGHALNGVNSIQPGSAWMVIGRKAGVDGDVADGGAAVHLYNSNIESSNKYGILLYHQSTIDCFSCFWAMNTATAPDPFLYPIYFELNGDAAFNGGSSFYSPFVGRGYLDSACNFANGMAAYANSQAVHANGFPQLEIDMPITGGSSQLSTYYNHITSTVEMLPRRDGRFFRRVITGSASIQPYGAGYIEVDSTGGPITITLTWAGWYQSIQHPIWIKDVGGAAATNPITVVGGAGSTIDGGGSYIINTGRGSVVLIPNGDTTTPDYRIAAQYPGPFRSAIVSSSHNIDNWNATGISIPYVFRGSTDNGGVAPSPKYPVLILARDGVPSATYASIVEFLVRKYENTGGSHARTELSIAMTHGAAETSGTDVMIVRSDKSVRFTGEFGGDQIAGTGNGAINVDWSAINQYRHTLNGNVTFSFSGGKAGHSYTLITVQSGGPHTLTWPTIKWPGGVVGVITATAGAVDLWTFYYDGTNYLNIAKSQALA